MWTWCWFCFVFLAIGWLLLWLVGFTEFMILKITKIILKVRKEEKKIHCGML